MQQRCWYLTHHTAMAITISSIRTTSAPATALTGTIRPNSCLITCGVLGVGMDDVIGSGVTVTDNELVINEVDSVISFTEDEYCG